MTAEKAKGQRLVPADPSGNTTDGKILPHKNVGGNDNAAIQKAEANAIARLALLGHRVNKCPTGYFVSKWDYVRHCGDVESLEAFADMVSGRSR